MVAARDTDEERGDDPDVLFNGKYPPEAVIVEQQVLRDGNLRVTVRRKRKKEVPPRN